MACNDCLVALKGTDSAADDKLGQFMNSKAGPVIVVAGSAAAIYFLARLLFGGGK
jgi:hypothetical protein